MRLNLKKWLKRRYVYGPLLFAGLVMCGVGVYTHKTSLQWQGLLVLAGPIVITMFEWLVFVIRITHHSWRRRKSLRDTPASDYYDIALGPPLTRED